MGSKVDGIQTKESSMPVRAFVIITVLSVLVVSKANTAAQVAPKLNYEFFKSRVEPIFLVRRPGHARCYMCHVQSNNALHLERLSPNARTWTEEQSLRNFQMVSALVNPGDPKTSRLLLHPLAPEAGGDVFHSGGRQFASKRDRAWRTLVEWVNGAKLGAPKK
jgi:hypothetical protein